MSLPVYQWHNQVRYCRESSSICVLHLVIPAHYFNASFASLSCVVFDCVWIGRMNHDQINTTGDEVLDLLNLNSRVVIAVKNCVLPNPFPSWFAYFAKYACPIAIFERLNCNADFKVCLCYCVKSEKTYDCQYGNNWQSNKSSCILFS